MRQGAISFEELLLRVCYGIIFFMISFCKTGALNRDSNGVTAGLKSRRFIWTKFDIVFLVFFVIAFTITVTGFSVSFVSFYGIGQPSMSQLVVNIVHHNAPEVIYTNDVRNCGKQKYQGSDGGCFDSTEPNVLYVSPGLSYAEAKYITLHELGHYEQYIHNLPPSECGADAYARQHGADVKGSIYFSQCHEG